MAGVGELRAVAERLLETGAQYLEQGREWLHAATRREQDDGYGDEHAHRGSEEGFGPPARGFREDDGGPRAPSAHGDDDPGFREYGTGEGPQGQGRARTRAGHDYDDRRAREFDAHADRLARAPWRGHGGGARHYGGAPDESWLPGSYGFGGEGRPQSGAAAEQGRGHRFQEAAGRWEHAYRAQGLGGHRGRGPRGYTRSDERILEEVSERLCDDPIVDASDIDVRCEGGCVVLEGRVPTRWMKHRAEDIADAVSGVKDVDNRVRVSAEEPAPHGDFDTSSRRRDAQGAGPDTAGKSSGSASGTGAGDATGQPPAASMAGKASTSGQAGTRASSSAPPEPQQPH